MEVKKNVVWAICNLINNETAFDEVMFNCGFLTDLTKNLQEINGFDLHYTELVLDVFSLFTKLMSQESLLA